MPATPVGLLVVHGIGDQRGGELSRELASGLGGSMEDAALPYAVHSAKSTVDGRPVVIAEAHWSDLSSLQNPPAVRSVKPIIADLLQTIRVAVRNARVARILRRADRRCHRAVSVILVLAAAYALSVLIAWGGSRETLDPWPLLLRALGALYLAFALHLVWRSVRYRLARLRRAAALRRYSEAAAWGAAAYLFGSLWVFFLPMFGGILLAYFCIAVLVTVVLAVALALVARALAAIGALLGRVRAGRARARIHRLGWITIVLPAHTLLEAMRSVGNLLSVITTERALVPRLAATGGLFGVYLGALALLVVCELIYMPVIVAVILVLPGGNEGGEAWTAVVVAMVVLLAAYQWLIARATPAIDLLLDVANYHLAGSAERRLYHARIARAAAALRDRGCARIHVLAHSLGTVLTYDWLQSLPPGSSPVATLLTIGSPLDKFWYVDHGPARRRTDRAGMDGKVSGRWRNFWAPSDVVSGALDRYGVSGSAVSNERLQRLGPLFVSHVRYWQNPVVLSAVRDALSSAR